MLAARLTRDSETGTSTPSFLESLGNPAVELYNNPEDQMSAVFTQENIDVCKIAVLFKICLYFDSIHFTIYFIETKQRSQKKYQQTSSTTTGFGNGNEGKI